MSDENRQTQCSSAHKVLHTHKKNIIKWTKLKDKIWFKHYSSEKTCEVIGY